ncbi:UxaA family hydrolase [Candidatus Bipolaricaulota bacterium]|nr:UxaA family hydrolase [Candidatus Bipolaricaulota bacterium]
MSDQELKGYRRENGAIGIRNHVVIIPVDDISNAAVEGVSKLIPQTTPLPHPYGRLQYGEDLDLLFRTLIGHGKNPNVGAAIVIGIEPNWTEKIVEGIAETGKPVAGFSIETHGDLETIRKASKKAKEFVQKVTEIPREPVKLEEMTFSSKCGESDTTTGLASNPAVGAVVDRLVEKGSTFIIGETSEVTGAEHIIADQAVNDEVKQDFLDMFDEYMEEIEYHGGDIHGSQPTQGNIAGGLSTLEEKGLGNIEKAGNAPIQSVLDYAEGPSGPGLHFMKSSSAAAEMVTLCAAGGSAAHLFTTGQGNIVGHPILPVIKTTANPKTASEMDEHIDVDISGLLKQTMKMEEAGDALMKALKRTINGRRTAAETLRHKEFILTKLFPSA